MNIIPSPAPSTEEVYQRHIREIQDRLASSMGIPREYLGMNASFIESFTGTPTDPMPLESYEGLVIQAMRQGILSCQAEQARLHCDVLRRMWRNGEPVGLIHDTMVRFFRSFHGRDDRRRQRAPVHHRIDLSESVRLDESLGMDGAPVPEDVARDLMNSSRAVAARGGAYQVQFDAHPPEVSQEQQMLVSRLQTLLGESETRARRGEPSPALRAQIERLRGELERVTWNPRYVPDLDNPLQTTTTDTSTGPYPFVDLDASEPGSDNTVVQVRDVRGNVIFSGPLRAMARAVRPQVREEEPIRDTEYVRKIDLE